MRTVLHLINTGGPGGAETVYLDLVRGLDASRWRSVAVLPNHEWMWEQMYGGEPAPVLLRPRGRFDAGYFASLLRLMRRERVDLVHAHLFGPAETASLLHLASGVPTVATLHGAGDVAGVRLPALKFGLLNRGLRRVVVVSEALRRHVVETTPLRPSLVTVIPNGVDTRLFTPARDDAVRRELGIGADEFVVGAVGNLRPAKGFDVLLRAAALLKERAPGFRFVIVGQAQGPLYDELRRQRAELGLEREAVFAGFRDDVHRAMAGFDLYAITSRHEGFSISTIQAMAAALPVVATRCGGPEEILEDGRTGVLVPNESAEAVAGAILRLRERPGERAELGERARAAAEARFTLAAQIRAYEAVYDEALSPEASRVRARSALLAPRA